MHRFRIGVLTSGGDCPGLNAVIRATVSSAHTLGWEVLGFIDGYEGLLSPVNYRILTLENTQGIMQIGGTTIGTTNRGRFVAKQGLGEKAMIRVAAKRGQSIAAILTLRHGDVLVYKYGCSDTLQSRLGGMPFLFWQLVQEAKQQRIRVLDLGRSDRDNHGLVAFKDRLGAARSTIAYWTYPKGISGKVPASWAVGVGKALLGHMPDSWLATTGKLLYRHLG